MNKNGFEKIVAKLPPNIGRIISFLPDEIKNSICEIRVNADNPVILTVYGKPLFLSKSGTVCETPNGELLITPKEVVTECFYNLCNHSVFAHSSEIANGYLAAGYGCRVGLCGKYDGENLVDVTSLNIRISREFPGCSDMLLDYCENGLLIAGPPASGKTTILRDIVKSLSSGKTGKYIRVCIVDSREEITVGYNMGYSADCLIVNSKSKGIEMALRTMSPQIIAFDEIGSIKELQGVKNSLNAGVKIITTAHAGSVDELLKRNVTKELIKSGAIEYTALLSGKLGDNPTVIKSEEIIKNDF